MIYRFFFILQTLTKILKQHISEKDGKELVRRTSNVSDLKIDRDNEFMETSLGPDGLTTQVNVVLGSSTTIANHTKSGTATGEVTGQTLKLSNDYR